MSETQKLFASISGTFAVHAVLLLLLLPPLLIQNMRWKPEVPDSLSERQEPMEVVVDLAELLDEIETEPVEPEPEPPVEETPLPFVMTESNEPELLAPEVPVFESDRNTTAAALMRPNPNLPPDYNGPTTEGDLPVPDITLRETDYHDGEALGRRSDSTSTNVEKLLKNVSLGSRRTLPKKGASEVENQAPLMREGDNSTLSQEKMQKLTRATDKVGERVQEAMSANTFTDPAGSHAVVEKPGSEDMEESTDQVPDEIGDNADPPAEMVRKLEEVEVEEENQLNPADAGLFADGLSLEERMSVLNGESSRLGENAVDAEETPLGKYKRRVWEAVVKQWRREHARYKDDFTIGILRIEGYVHRDGSISRLKVLESETTTLAVERSLHAIEIAEIPPMPPDVAERYGKRGLHNEFKFIIY